MAWLWGDSFDLYGSDADLGLAYQDYSTLGANVKWDPTHGRNGGGCFQSVVNGVIGKGVAPGSDIAIVAAAFAPTAYLSGASGTIFTIWNGTSARPHIGLLLNSDGSVSAWRANAANNPGFLTSFFATFLGKTAAGLVPIGGYTHIGARVKIHASAGEITIYINGAVRLNLTGIDTHNSSAADTTYSEIYLACPSANPGAYIDDFYILDDQGAQNNTFLGDKQPEIILPNNVGNTTQWTPHGAASNWAAVDDNPQNGDTDYVFDSTPGDKDTYAHPALLNITKNIKVVQVKTVAKVGFAGTRAIQHVIRSGGADYDGGIDQYLSTSYATQATPFELDPNGNIPWTAANINATEFGQKVTV